MMKKTTAPPPGEPATGNVLPQGTRDQIVQGSLKLGGYRFQVGVTATTVTEADAARGQIYDLKTRAKVRALATDLSQWTDGELQDKAAKLAKVLGVDPQVLLHELDCQEAGYEGHKDVWSLLGIGRRGRRVIDGTRRLARATIEADTERKRATLPPEAQQQIDEDLALYHEAQAQDQAGRLEARRLTQGILAAGQQQIGAFNDRRQLVDTLDRVAAGEELPWSEMLKAGATLDRLLAQDQPPPIPGPGDPGKAGGKQPAGVPAHTPGGNRRGRQRQ